MHPIDKKNSNLAIFIIVIAILVAAFSIFHSVYYLIALAAFGLLALSNTMKIKHRLVLMAIFSAIGFPIILIFDQIFIKEFIDSPQAAADHFYLSFLFASIFLVVPFFFLYVYFIQVTETAKSEKDHYLIIQKAPYLICKMHHTRTIDYSILGYKSVKCRVHKKCLKHNDIVMAVRLVGLIGVLESGKQQDGDYFVTLWEHRLRKIRYGDYDVIEIHENEEIKDYDFVISKLITFFDNEIDRYKPLNEVVIKIVGNPLISENTMRLMANHFLKVEYLNS